MNILIATDSFKGSLTSIEVSKEIKEAFTQELPNSKINILPMADGGEGTLDALLFSVGGKKVLTITTGADGREISTCFGVLSDNATVVIEIAQIVGYKNKSNPTYGTTYGVGEVILQALDKGFRKFIIGLGGSSTNDGGLGMLQALGGSFYYHDKVIPTKPSIYEHITSVNLESIDHRLKESEIKIVTDVMNPLYGENGATYVFGPQKGIQSEDLKKVDNFLKNYSSLVEVNINNSLHDIKGAGAAGGLGFGLLSIGGEIFPGASFIGKKMLLEDKIKFSDLIITGEGKSDYQTLYGKVPFHVANLARKHNVKTILISGCLGEGYQQLSQLFTSCHSTAPGPISLESSMNRANELIFESSKNIAKLIHSFRA